MIGILTQPIALKSHGTSFKNYIIEVHDRWLKMSGMRTVAIPYEIPLNELEALLPMLNGVYLPGGSLSLVNNVTK